LPRDNDKNTVVALREIAERSIDKAEVQEDLVQSYQRVHESENDDIDLAELIGSEMDDEFNAGDAYGEEADDTDNSDEDMALSDDEMIASLAAGE
jgi:DNA-directed RNA polymerase subunit omega